MDFGVSKFATETALARTGTVIGTQGYAAPEQSEGKIYFSSDLFGLGRTCFHLLTDTHPSKVFYALVLAYRSASGRVLVVRILMTQKQNAVLVSVSNGL